jgi:hypothetical protein
VNSGFVFSLQKNTIRCILPIGKLKLADCAHASEADSRRAGGIDSLHLTSSGRKLVM